MLNSPTILEQLQQRWEDLREFERDWQIELREYGAALEKLARLSGGEIQERIGAVESPGALPTAELDRQDGMLIGFDRLFRHHEEARRWAAGVLSDQPIVAVDGSQIPPAPDMALPVAAVQAAWFENHHTSDGHYERQVEFELLTPVDLRTADDNDEPHRGDEIINLRRFELETRILGSRLSHLAGKSKEGRLPIGLLDGSLVISFADRLPEEWRSRYAEAVLGLLRQSEQAGIPVIGYVDGSRSRDLLHLLAIVFGLPPARRINDAWLLAEQLTWGSRTPLLVCARGSADRGHSGILELLAEYRRGIGFVYLRTGRSTPLARLEIPLWVMEKGLLDRAVDMVRAEVVVGNGYPYAIQSADAAAAVSRRDREQFEAIVRHFTAGIGIEKQITAKSISKTRRR